MLCASSGLSGGAIAGIVVGSVVGAALLCVALTVVVYITCGRRRNKRDAAPVSAG